MIQFKRNWNTFEIQKREAQNAVKQYLPWDTDSASFNVYWHYASKIFDQTPGTFIQTVVIKGYIVIEVQDIVEDFDTGIVHNIN